MKKLIGFLFLLLVVIFVFGMPLLIYYLAPIIYNCDDIRKFIVIPNEHDINTIYWTVALTYSTILLAIVAVFQEHIKSFLWRPILTCELDLAPPHSHLFANIHNTDQKAYYIRMKIGNIGQVSAENVEVFLKEVKKNNININLSSDNLQWSSEKIIDKDKDGFQIIIPRYYWKYISPNTYQYCNIGDFQYAECTLSRKLIFNFCVCWKTPQEKYKVEQGEYECDLVISAANAKPINKQIKFIIGHEWQNDEKQIEKMFRIL